MGISNKMFFQLVISITVTVFFYGIGPFLLWKTRKRPIKLSHFRLFCIFYTLLLCFVWDLFTFDGIVLPNPAIIWGLVVYNVFKNRVQDKPLYFTPAIPAQKNVKDAAERWYTCPKCGQLVRDGEACDCETIVSRRSTQGTPADDMNETISRKSVSFVLGSICVLLLVCSCLLGLSAYENRISVQSLTQENAELSETIQKLSNQLIEKTRENEELLKKSVTEQWSGGGLTLSRTSPSP